VPAAADIDEATGRGRLSYPRAEHLFKTATAAIDPHGNGWTLHQLRHSVSPAPRPGRTHHPNCKPNHATSTWPASVTTSASVKKPPHASPPNTTPPRRRTR
jgi:hypothetical protein